MWKGEKKKKREGGRSRVFFFRGEGVFVVEGWRERGKRGVTKGEGEERVDICTTVGGGKVPFLSSQLLATGEGQGKKGKGDEGVDSFFILPG